MPHAEYEATLLKYQKNQEQQIATAKGTPELTDYYKETLLHAFSQPVMHEAVHPGPSCNKWGKLQPSDPRCPTAPNKQWRLLKSMTW